MLRYIAGRLLGMIPLFFGITMLSFLVIKLAPGKSVILQQALNPRISAQELARLEKLEGEDKPVLVQYLNWLRNIATFSFGTSFSDGRPVAEKIIERIPLTLGINLASLLLICLIALPLGIYTALRADSGIDHGITVIGFLILSAPAFWLALLCMQLFSIRLGLLPLSGVTSLDFEYFSLPEKIIDVIRHLLLPVLISGFGGFVGLYRYMRSSMIETLRAPYITAARAKGLPERTVILTHALRNAALPVITILGLSLPGLLGGSVLFESVFAIPGLGQLFYEAAMMRDKNLIMAEVVLVAVLTMLGNLLADVAYRLVDPRIRT